jgi:hypothetical protein
MLNINANLNIAINKGNPILSGINWSSIIGPPDIGYTDVAYGNGRFVAVANTGANRIYTSDDFGLTWAPRAAAENIQFRGICFAEDIGLWCAVGLSGTFRVQTSPDGTTWTGRTAAAANQWSSVRRANGRFVSTAISGTGRIQWSTDGISWTLGTGASNTLTYWNVDFGDGMWIAVAAGSTSNINKLARSIDNGTTWTQYFSTTQQFLGIRYVDHLSRWVLIGGDGTNRLKWSDDGLSFTNGTGVDDAVQWEKADFSSDIIVAIGSTSGTTRITSTFNGKDWTSRITPALNNYLGIAYGSNGTDEAFIAVSNTGTGNRIMVSS